jgi:hypothetical protein
VRREAGKPDIVQQPLAFDVSRDALHPTNGNEAENGCWSGPVLGGWRLTLALTSHNDAVYRRVATLQVAPMVSRTLRQQHGFDSRGSRHRD